MIGSSPQARGTLNKCPKWQRGTRFIPAGAGNTWPVPGDRPACSVHPRRRGEHACRGPAAGRADGSSPQARGTLGGRRPCPVFSRFIPAGAGNTPGICRKFPVQTVHPRRRGEHQISRPGIYRSAGSSPQARGTRILDGRGLYRQRFIPAGAGNTHTADTGQTLPPVHPRRRGEHACDRGEYRNVGGSSPQARGTPELDGVGRDNDRFIPAGAGNTDKWGYCVTTPSVHPRRRGEHICQALDCRDSFGSSPQARGTLTYNGRRAGQLRFIPAGAGNTGLGHSRRPHISVHPRRRGEHRRRLAPRRFVTGSSPQARGTLA